LLGPRLRPYIELAAHLTGSFYRPQLTLLVPRDDGGYSLPVVDAPFDGQPHPAEAWPFGAPLLAWYEVAGLVTRTADGQWQSAPDALAPLDAATRTAQTLNIFLDRLRRARCSQRATADRRRGIAAAQVSVLSTSRW
jgi:hypothetical protein